MNRFGGRGRVLACATVLLCATAGRAFAQAAPAEGRPLAVGDRVRVTFDDARPRIRGPVSALDDTSISVVSHRSEAVTLVYRDIRAVHRHEGRASAGSGALRGAGMGFLIGAGVGVLATGIVHVNESREGCGRDGICYGGGSLATALTAYFGLLFTVGTTTVGAGIGALAPPERWRRVSLPALVGIAPLDARGRRGIGLVARF